jgi:hypothetical protein
MININNKILYKVFIPKRNKKKFVPNVYIERDDKKKCFEFAYNMAFGHNHNPNSFGSKKVEHKRSEIEIFRDAFQGKLAEIGFYNYYSVKKGFNIPPPDFNIWKRGKWEDTDFEATAKGEKYKISIKSTKNYGQLLLLEKDRYDSNGYYMEGVNEEKVKHDLIFLVRVKGVDSFIDNLSVKKDENLFKQLEIEVTGYISHKNFVEIIKAGRFIQKGVMIGNQVLKVDNYYAFASELRLNGQLNEK